MKENYTHNLVTKQLKIFRQLLKQETMLLKQLLDENKIKNPSATVGLELETWLTDENGFPSPTNQEFLNAFGHKNVGPELSSFNVELNSNVFELNNFGLEKSFENLRTLWHQVQTRANSQAKHLLMVGSLPNLKPQDLCTKNMSPSFRYKMLNHNIFVLRKNRPLFLDIKGEERLKLTSDSIMPEAGATSLQIHYCPPIKKIERYINAATILSAPIAALCANAPYIFGKDLWSDSRIPLFEQAVALPCFDNINGNTINRVTLGNSYVKNIFDLYLENMRVYPVLLPQLDDHPNVPFGHLHIQNGTVWRWNRPILGFNSDQSIHIRIEHRVPSAGPSVTDVIANLAFFTGVLFSLAEDDQRIEEQIAFEDAKNNFYLAAQFGLEAEIKWRNKKETIFNIILQELIPLAEKGLLAQGVEKPQVEFFIKEVIKERVSKKMTGTSWQRLALKKLGGDLNELVKHYYLNQEKGLPVSRWEL